MNKLNLIIAAVGIATVAACYASSDVALKGCATDALRNQAQVTLVCKGIIKIYRAANGDDASMRVFQSALREEFPVILQDIAKQSGFDVILKNTENAARD